MMNKEDQNQKTPKEQETLDAYLASEKVRIGQNIRILRLAQGITTYDIAKEGFHATVPNTIELGKKGYTIDKLMAYLEANNLQLEVRKKPEPPVQKQLSEITKNQHNFLH